MTGPAFTLIALLYVNPGRQAELERFESAAARIMARYGGTIERRIRLAGDAAMAPSERFAPPDEVHIVTFPDAASFARYRADAELSSLADLRALAIRETVIWQGVEGPPFADGPNHDETHP